MSLKIVSLQTFFCGEQYAAAPLWAEGGGHQTAVRPRRIGVASKAYSTNWSTKALEDQTCAQGVNPSCSLSRPSGISWSSSKSSCLSEHRQDLCLRVLSEDSSINLIHPDNQYLWSSFFTGNPGWNDTTMCHMPSVKSHNFFFTKLRS